MSIAEVEERYLDTSNWTMSANNQLKNGWLFEEFM